MPKDKAYIVTAHVLRSHIFKAKNEQEAEALFINTYGPGKDFSIKEVKREEAPEKPKKEKAKEKEEKAPAKEKKESEKKGGFLSAFRKFIKGND